MRVEVSFILRVHLKGARPAVPTHQCLLSALGNG